MHKYYTCVKGFVFVPARVDGHDEAIKALQVEVKDVQGRASATDIAIARIEPQLAAIVGGIAEIKSDIRDLRTARRGQ